MLFLDDATLDNGCLRVVPGSHTQGVWKTGAPTATRSSATRSTLTAYADVESVPLECAAGIAS